MFYLFQENRKSKKTDEISRPDYLVNGIWVIVAFEDTWYPGLVSHINQENKELTIKFMHLCKGSEGKFQWPTKEDKTKVDIKFVIFVPLPPVSKNNNRTFEFEGTECIQVLYEKFKERYFV